MDSENAMTASSSSLQQSTEASSTEPSTEGEETAPAITESIEKSGPIDSDDYEEEEPETDQDKEADTETQEGTKAIEKEMESDSTSASDSKPDEDEVGGEATAALEENISVEESSSVSPTTPSIVAKDEEHEGHVASSDPNEALEPETAPPAPITPHSSFASEEEDDVARKAAVTLAAVAAAATANHKSPAQAAKQARLAAQSYITTADVDTSASNSPSLPEAPSADAAHLGTSWRTFSWSAVCRQLRQIASSQQQHAFVYQLAAHPEQHAGFLQHVLLLQYVLVQDDDDGLEEERSALSSTLEDDSQNTTAQAMEETQIIASVCEHLVVWLKKMEAAYDSLLDLLPKQVTTRNATITPTLDGVDLDAPVMAVPDLLPPCTSTAGDATLLFFKACVGDQAEQEEDTDQADAAPSSPTRRPDTALAQPSQQEKEEPKEQQNNSFMAGLFKKRTSKKGFFRGRSSMSSNSSGVSNTSSHNDSSTPHPTPTRQGELYSVTIERELLGLTVENVLERTVVRTVLAGGPAKKAGAQVGSLITQVGQVETKFLTHFETIDELRQSQRPLQLFMKQIPQEALRAAREEMGRLIRGSGFGTVVMNENNEDDKRGESKDGRPLMGADLRIDAYTRMVRSRFEEADRSSTNSSKKEQAIGRLGEKLVWLLNLFVVGLEREASRLSTTDATSDAGASDQPNSPSRRHSLHSCTAKDYEDAAKSVSKVLLDYTRRRVDPSREIGQERDQGAGSPQQGMAGDGALRRRKGFPPPLQGGRGSPFAPGGIGQGNSTSSHDGPLLQIGDVLQRTRTFLSDTASPPAALLRGELIAFLCEVLDVDSEMQLAEEESATWMAGGSGAQAGMITDLGSAGSLLKLIVLNCPVMRSPGCEEEQGKLDAEVEEELKRRFGPRDNFTSTDLHRLHAGNRFLSIVHRLAASRSTSARITACSLGPVLWGHLDFPHQLQLRGVITRALHDVEVIVRKATATVLHEIAELVFDRRSVPWLVLMCERAMTDPDPMLRSAAMTLTWHLAEHLPNAFLGDASQGSRYLRRLPSRDDPIFADVYLLQCKLLPVATRLAEDRSPSVRLAVAAQCDRLCDALGDHWSSVIIDVLLALLSDTDDGVRCEAVSCVPRLAEIILLSASPGEVAVSEVSILEALVPASMKLQSDPSASVRMALAASTGELLSLLVALQSRLDESLMASFPQSSGDLTSSERTDAEVDKKYKKQIDDRLIPLLQSLLNDKDPEVTSAALRAVTNATRSSIHQTRTRHMSIASEDDASHSSYQSQTSDMKAPVFSPVLSEKQVLRLLPTLTELADSRQWRVRQSAVEIVPALLGCTYKHETRMEISKLCIRLMSDQVDAVRKTAAECLCMGGSSLGSHGDDDSSAEWMSSIVIPAVRKCAVDRLSKQRLLSLKMIEVILVNGVFPTKWGSSHKADPREEEVRLADSPLRELAGIALSLTTDHIANVRLNVGRVLGTVLHVFSDDDLSFIREVLLQQIDAELEREHGGDRDVLYFANQCLQRAKSLLEERSSLTSDVRSELL